MLYDNPNSPRILLARLLNALPLWVGHAIANPKTTCAGIAALAMLPTLHGLPQKLSAIITGVGLLLAKDSDQGSTKPPVEADAAITKVEKIEPNSEPKS